MPLPRIAVVSKLALALAFTLAAAAQDQPAAAAATPAVVTTARPAYLADPKFVSTVAEARLYERQRQYLFALDDWKKASKIAGGACTMCLDKLYKLQMGIHNFKDALATSNQLEANALLPIDKSIAEDDRGDAILGQAGDKPKPAQLDAAHQAFQQALSSYPKNNAARYHDACVLVRLGKDDDASKEFAACAAAASPTDPMAARARHFAEDPRLSLNRMAPPFEVTTLEGNTFNLDDMHGRVVLIDFWATWCVPCNEELPHLAKLVKEFTGQPLVVISISVDKDEAKWKNFVAQHQMTWVQYRDSNGSIASNFGNTLIPSYYMIGSDGVMVQTSRMGTGDNVEGKLKKLIKQATEANPAPIAEHTGTN